MKKETKKSLSRVTEEAILDVAGSIVGAICEHAIAPFVMAVIKYDFLWRNPNASKEATDLRVKQEGELLLAKLRHEGYVNIRNVEPSRIYYARRSFAVYLEDLLDRMYKNGATKEELDSITDMRWEFSRRYGGCHGHISTNNLRWIIKMENKYGVEEET